MTQNLHCRIDATRARAIRPHTYGFESLGAGEREIELKIGVTINYCAENITMYDKIEKFMLISKKCLAE